MALHLDVDDNRAAFNSKLLIWLQTHGQDFNPVVTARCERGYMVINVSTKQPFHGIVHTRDYRNKAHCFATGSGGLNTTLRISAIASRGETSYCGVSGGQVSQTMADLLPFLLHDKCLSKQTRASKRRARV
jgi:hypothetical protein